MDDIEEKVLMSTKGFLERLTNADALTPDLLTEAHMAVTVLGYQLARARYDSGVLQKVREAEADLAEELRCVCQETSSVKRMRRKWLERWQSGVGAKLSSVLANTAISSRLDDRTECQMAREIRDFLVTYHQPLDPMISAGTRATYQGGRGDNRETEKESSTLTALTLQDYLGSRFPEYQSTTVSSLNRLMGGYSKETYIVNLTSPTDDSKIVIRKDGIGLPTGSSVIDEFPIIQQAYTDGVLSPRPLWLEADSKYFGTALMAVGFEEGKPAHLNVPERESTRIKWSDSIARTVARLHRSTCRTDLDIRDAMQDIIAEHQQRVEDNERTPHPGLVFGLNWLNEHLDDVKGRPVCRVHGDVGFHNMLMRNDELLVLLDWEFSHLSDPMEDLIYVKPFIDQLDTWQPFLEVYEAESGFRFDVNTSRYFSVWKEVRNAANCTGLLNTLLMPQVESIALCVAGTIYIPKFEVAILDAILEGEKTNV